MDDVRRIVERLSQHVEEEGDREVALLKRPPEQSEEEFKKIVSKERERAFRITVTVAGNDGQDLSGYGTEVFDSPNLPDDIASIYVSNEAAYQGVAGRRPINRFSVNFDFSKPPLVDNSNPVSDPTPNFSNLTIEGDRDSWVAAIQEATMGVLSKRSNGRRFLHAAFVYDIGLLLFSFPLGLYVCWRLSGAIHHTLGQHSGFLSGVAYFYIMLSAVWAYRIFFGYTKWSYPTVELREAEDRSKRHRKFWYAILTSFVAGLLVELIN